MRVPIQPWVCVAGWLLMWYCVLSQIGFVRSLFDLDDRDRKKAAERQKR